MKRHSRKSLLKQFKKDLCVNEDGSHWLNDAEFKRKYRVSRMTLDRRTTAIEHKEVFAEGARGPNLISVKHQVMVLLQFLGKEGETNESQRQTFKTGYGTNKDYHDRVVQALTDLRKEYIQWLDEDERKEISARIEKSFIFQIVLG